MKKGWWPKYLNAPMQVAFWEFDEIFPAMVGIFFMVAFKTIIPLIIGLGVTYMLVKTKANLPKNFLINMCYMLGIFSIPGSPVYVARRFRK